MPLTQPVQDRFQCRHLFTDGRRCGSPSLRQELFCFYHHTTRRPAAPATQGPKSAFHLPQPEDRAAIQFAIGEILRRIAANELDSRRAGLLLYGLQIASLNLPRQAAAKHEEDPAEPVEEIESHPTHGAIAPETLYTEYQEKPRILTEFLRQIDGSENLCEDSHAIPGTLSSLEAANA